MDESALQPAQPVRHLVVGGVGVDDGRQGAGVSGKSLRQEQVSRCPVDVRNGRVAWSSRALRWQNR